MHRHHGEYGRNDRYFAHPEVDGDWDHPQSKRGRSRTYRVRRRPYDKYSHTRKYDWLDDLDRDDE